MSYWWALIALPLVGGGMNLPGTTVIAVFAPTEKVLPSGR